MAAPVSPSSASPADGLSLRRYGASRGSHSHEHFQVLLGLEGVLDLEVEGRGRRIAAGDGHVVLPGERHDFEAPGAAGSQCLVLDTTQPLWARCAGLAPPPARMKALARYLALSLGVRDAPLAQQWGPALLLEAWSPPIALLRSQRRIDWTALAAWSRARWRSPIAVADLAAVACLSPAQFAQRCRSELGQSPMQWLRAQRLAHAHQLRAAGFGVAEVAREVGYRSPSALTAAMRRTALPRR